MKAVFVAKNGGFELREIAPSPVLPGQLKIRTIASLISSGTERYYLQRGPVRGESLSLGYCAVGVVEGLGANVVEFNVGDYVAALGWGYAIHAEQINMPYRLCAKIPRNGSVDEFVFAPLAATALHMIHRSDLQSDEKALVVGLGPVGQLGIQIARTISPYVYGTDLLDNRLRAAQAGGATAVFNSAGSLSDSVRKITSDEGVAVVFLCLSGEATEVFEQSILALQVAPDGNRKGRVIPTGRFHARVDFSAEMGNVDIRVSSRCGAGYRDDRYVHGELSYDLKPGEPTVNENLKACVRMIQSQELRPEVFHTHRIPFSQAKDAYDLLMHPEQAIGITLHYPSEG